MSPCIRLSISILAGLLCSQSVLALPPLVEVQYKDGLLRVKAEGASLALVFQEIRRATGMESILDGESSNVALTVDVGPEAMYQALQEMLRGVDVSYVVMGFSQDRKRVEMIYVGESNVKNPAARARALRRAAKRANEISLPPKPAPTKRAAPSWEELMDAAASQPVLAAKPDAASAQGGEPETSTANELAMSDGSEPNASSGELAASETQPSGTNSSEEQPTGSPPAMPSAPPPMSRSAVNPGDSTEPSAEEDTFHRGLDAFGRPIRVKKNESEKKKPKRRNQE